MTPVSLVSTLQVPVPGFKLSSPPTPVSNSFVSISVPSLDFFVVTTTYELEGDEFLCILAYDKIITLLNWTKIGDIDHSLW